MLEDAWKRLCDVAREATFGGAVGRSAIAGSCVVWINKLVLVVDESRTNGLISNFQFA